MSKKRSKINLGKVKAILPYFAVAVITLAVVALGSLDKQSADINLSLDTEQYHIKKCKVDYRP